MATTSDNLHALLLELERYARAGGAPEAFLNGAMRQLIDLAADAVTARRLAELQERRQQAELVDRLRGGGLTLIAACKQAGTTPRTIQRRRRGDNGASLVASALKSWR